MMVIVKQNQTMNVNAVLAHIILVGWLKIVVFAEADRAASHCCIRLNRMDSVACPHNHTVQISNI